MLNKLIATPGHILGCCIFDGKEVNDGSTYYHKEETFNTPFPILNHRVRVKYCGYTGVCHTDGWERQGVSRYDTPKDIIMVADWREVEEFHILEDGHGTDHYFDGAFKIKVVTGNLVAGLWYRFTNATAEELCGAWGFSIQIM